MMAGLPNGHASPAPPASQLIQEKLQQRLEAFKKSDDERNALVQASHFLSFRSFLVFENTYTRLKQRKT